MITRPPDNKPPVIEVIPSVAQPHGYGSIGSYGGYGGLGGGSGGYSTNTRTIPSVTLNPPLCQPAQSCGCLPCEYKILMYLNQARLGPISGANIKLYKATEENKPNRTILYEGKTSISNSINEAGILKLPIPYAQQTKYSEEEQKFMDDIANYDGDFILEVSGGYDIDKDDNFKVDSNYTPLNGKLHLIVTKKRLLEHDYKVNVLTEISYQLSQDLLGDAYDKVRLQERLDDIAQHIFIEKLYPDATQPLGRDDLYSWVPMAHKNWLVKPYDKTLKAIVEKIYAGVNIYEDAYNYVYNPLSTEIVNIPTLKSQWIGVDENISAGAFIGKIKYISEGNSSIEGYKLSRENATLFRVENNGEVYLEDNVTLDYEETNVYQLGLEAYNQYGNSQPVTLYVIVNNILDAPEDRNFTGESIAEDAPEGTIVGVLSFDEGAAPIERIDIGGKDASSFTVDTNGIIRISSHSSLDYERTPGAHITLQAFNAYGGSRIVPLSFSIVDAVDVPTVKMLDIHVDENITSNSPLGTLEILSNDPLLEVKLIGDGADVFKIDSNGTVFLSNGKFLDYETRSNYVFEVYASNIQGIGRPGSLIVRVNNIPDVPDLNTTILHMMEQNSLNAEIGNVIVDNIGSSNIISFTLSGAGNENFAIDSTGTITVLNENLKYNENEFFELFVTALNDSGTSLKTPLIIYVDTKRPILGILDTWVYEDANASTLLGTVPMIASDIPISSMELEGNGSNNFTINTLGEIRLSEEALLDYETISKYSLRVYATNNIGISEKVALYIRVIDKIDTVVIEGQSITIYEDIEKGTNIGKIKVIDYGGQNIEYYELSGKGSENFILDKTGVISIANDAVLDSEEDSKYHIELVAVDKNGIKSNKVYLDISIAKGINTIPKIKDLSLNISDSLDIGTILGKVSIVSKTELIKQVWLEGNKSNTFELLINGDIVLKKKLNYDNIKSYNLKMYARNSLGTSEAGTLDINIVDSFANRPKLVAYSGYIEENATSGTVVGVVEVLDNDSNISSFELKGAGSEDFRIDVNGKIYLGTNVILDESIQKIYNLQVYASNGVGKGNAVDAVIVVTYDKKVPSKPIDFEITGTTYGSIGVAWQSVDSSARGINLYLNGTLYRVLDSNETSYIMGGLSRDRQYTIGLTAFNDRGESEVSAVSAITDESGYEALKTVLEKRCNISSSVFKTQFNKETGEYTGSIGCYSTGITQSDMDNFKALRSVSDGLSISQSSMINVDGLSNLKYVGGYLSITGTQLENVDGLSKLESVGGQIRLSRNKLTNVDGLSKLTEIKGELDLSYNELINLDGLRNVTSISGDIKIQNNPNLEDITGLENMQGVNDKFFTIDTNQYSVKADGNSSLCATAWDLRDSNGNIPDGKSYICTE